MTNELILHEGNNNEFALLAQPDGQAIFSEMMELGIKDHKIPLVKIPGSAGTTWEVQLADGTDINSKELNVVIVWASVGHHQYYEAKYGEGESDVPPDCSSEGDSYGFGSMTKDGEKMVRDCTKCPKNEFGSASNGKGRACGEYTFLYCLLPEQMLPIRVRISPGSLEDFKDYGVGCLSGGKRMSHVVTSITLRKAGKTPDYAIATFKRVSNLPPDQLKVAGEIGSALKSQFVRRTAEQLQERYLQEIGGSVVVQEEVTESGEDAFGE